MIVIPAMDIIDGKVVRLSKGDYSSKVEYSANPYDMARMFEDAGLTHLHLVDLDGARGSIPCNLKVLEEVASKTELNIDFGGGIKSIESLKSAISAGAREVNVGSIAARDRDKVLSWIEEYKDYLILSADCRNGFISVSGWNEDTSLEVISFISDYNKAGLKKVISTDISKDGMLLGPSLELYSSIMTALPDESVIASGGVSSYEDLIKCRELNLYGVIVGKAYYEGKITLRELKEAESAC